jgi:plasmid maintenance system antidote protein VapI
VAKRLGITKDHVDQLCRGRRRAALELAFRVEALSRGAIPARFWLTFDPKR